MVGRGGGMGHGPVHGTPARKYWKMTWLDVTSCPAGPFPRPSPAALDRSQPQALSVVVVVYLHPPPR